MTKRRLIGFAVGATLYGLAISRELRKPAGERTWHGRVLGFVPYDLRPPTPRRIVARWWNTADNRIFTEQVFGVGWSVNLARVAQLAGRLAGGLAARRAGA